MIDLRTGVFTDLLPEHLRGTETMALAYAVGRQVEHLLAMADNVPFYAMLSTAPEKVLDHLAVELRVPAYREVFPLEIKRALIRDALLAYAKMGTPAVVDRTLDSIFGAGEIEEWFDYDGDPHHFRAVVPVEGNVTPQRLEEFYQVLVSVKRVSSWLDELITVTALPEKALRITPVLGAGCSVTALPALEPEMPPTPVYVTPLLGRGVSVTVLPFLEPERGATVTAVYPTASAGSATETRLPAAAEFETVVPAAAAIRPAVALHSASDTKLPIIKEEIL